MNDRTILKDRPALTFTGSPLDRGDLIRRDPDMLVAASHHQDARCILLRAGEPAMSADNTLHRFEMSDTANWDATGPLVYLGETEGQPLFACENKIESPAPHGTEFFDARQAARLMIHADAAIFAQARSLFAWRERHQFCANCGTPTRQAGGGAKRVCDACDAEHFPRVDPVVIMLAVDGDNCLLGRQANWPDGVWSALAGFVEPAETLEEACARELLEEAGVTADIAGIRYVMCQPWPLPHSLMVGLVAPVTDTTLTIDTHELEQARWFSRAEVITMLAGTHAEAVMPPSIAIARRLTELWVDGAI